MRLPERELSHVLLEVAGPLLDRLGESPVACNGSNFRHDIAVLTFRPEGAAGSDD